jgi:hypothetical protein
LGWKNLYKENENMENKILEQSDRPHPADNSAADLQTAAPNPAAEPADSDFAPTPGKFENVAELVRAYENLHAEFTRKSQRLKTLEQSYTDTVNAGAAKINKTEKVAVPAEGAKTIGDKGESAQITTGELQTADGLKNSSERVHSVLTESDRKKVIEEYLLSAAARSVAPAVITHSGSDFAPAVLSGARSIHASTKMAEDFFLSKGKV